MPYVTYENRRNPHVTIHREDCNQIAKRGGEHKYGQGNYSSHTTYSQANAYAVSTGLPLVVCSYCNPDSSAGPSSAERNRHLGVSTHKLTQTIGFIGAGQMARALARGLVEADVVNAEQIVASDAIDAQLDGFAAAIAGAKRARTNIELSQRADVVVLAVKPQQLEAATSELAGPTAGKLVVSILAGVRLSKLASLLPQARLARVMPNTPALVGQSASAYALGPSASQTDETLVATLLAAVGRSYRVDEKLLDAVTGLSGSGPAFVYVAIEALADGGVRMGLPRDVAMALAAQTVKGAAEMVLNTGDHPGVLKDRVASPGGTTIAGLAALENGGLRAALMGAVEAATKRSIELGAG